LDGSGVHKAVAFLEEADLVEKAEAEAAKRERAAAIFMLLEILKSVLDGIYPEL
jgi:hypothetical protein